MRFTYNLPGDLYTPAECVEQVEYFTQQIKKKFNSEYGPDIHNGRLEVLEFLYLVEKFLTNIFQKFFHYNGESESSGNDSSEEENAEDSAVAEEYIEYYADKYKKITREHKFAIPLCERTNKDEIYNAIEATSNIPAGYYITAECTRDVEKFAQKLHGKFGHKDGPFYADEVAIKIFLHDLEHFLTDIYHTHFCFE